MRYDSEGPDLISDTANRQLQNRQRRRQHIILVLAQEMETGVKGNEGKGTRQEERWWRVGRGEKGGSVWGIERDGTGQGKGGQGKKGEGDLQRGEGH